jgi:LysR family transcriptional regulator for metE and metH
LLDRQIDFALVSSPVRDRRVVTKRLFDDEWVVILAPTHPLASRPRFELEDFASETFLHFGPRDESTVYTEWLAPRGISPAHFMEIQLTEAIIEMVKAGLGVSVLAWWAAEPHVRVGTLRALPLTKTGFRKEWSAATLKDLERIANVREFIELLAGRESFVMPRTGAGGRVGLEQSRVRNPNERMKSRRREARRR